MNYVLFFAMADQKVIRLHITMDEVIIVQEFQPLNHLISNHQSGLDCEFTLAKIKCVLETWAKKIHDHSVVITFHSEPVNRRYSSLTIINIKLTSAI